MERNNKKLGPSLWKLSVMPLGPHTQKKRDATWRGFFMPAYTLEMKNVEVMGIQDWPWINWQKIAPLKVNF